jgi:regulatory protein YycH of two-component signal transduction system YycFG
MNTTIIVLLTVVVLILVVLLTWLIWRNHRQNDELKEKNEVIVREVRRRSTLEGRMSKMQTGVAEACDR